MSFLAPVIRVGLRSAGRYIYQGLRVQDKIIDLTYRRTGLYNRGVVRGIKHGLAGGAVVGGTLSLGLPEIEDDASPRNASRNKQYKKYFRNKRYSSSNYKHKYFNSHSRRAKCRPRYYKRSQYR